MEFNYNSYVNNIFIDDFNFVSGVLSSPLQEELIALKIAPNPTAVNSETILYYSLKQQDDLQISVVDLFGKTIAVVDLGTQLAGSHQYIFNPADLGISKGCYIIKIGNGKFSTSEKLLVL